MEGRLDFIGREKQIQIVLRAKARISYESRGVRESLQHYEVESFALQRAIYLLIRRLGSPPAFRVVHHILVEAVRDPNRQPIAATKRERNRQLRAVAEVSASNRGELKCNASKTARA
jgi:hypothetical protein